MNSRVFYEVLFLSSTSSFHYWQSVDLIYIFVFSVIVVLFHFFLNSMQLCTLEFETRRASYYWLLHALGIYQPYVWEYSRLNVTNTVMSKRKVSNVSLDSLKFWSHLPFCDKPNYFSVFAVAVKFLGDEEVCWWLGWSPTYDTSWFKAKGCNFNCYQCFHSRNWNH